MMADKSTKRGSLIVISGFSGVGKGTVVKRLVSDFGYNLSVSATTRSRPWMSGSSRRPTRI